MNGAERRFGFTIIELMITVGLVGILMSIAIPNYMRFQLKSKASEVKSNLAALHVAQQAYHGEYGVYTSAVPPIPAAVGTMKTPWPLSDTDAHGFNTLGFRPEGGGYFQYAVASDGNTAYTAAARSDIDGDTVFNTWGYVKPAEGTAIGVPGPFGTCPNSGVFDNATSVPNRLELAGPCDISSGRSVF